MKNLIVSIFLLVISFSVLDTNDPKKSMIVIDYGDNSPVDRLLIDKNELKDHNKIWNAIDKIITERENNK